MEEKDIIHTVLIETKKKTEITDEEIIKLLDPETKEEFDKASDNDKKLILRMFMKGKVSTENEVPNFLKKIGVFGQKELIEKMKEKLPSQYHSSLIK